jgi:hypothetical protein
MMPPTILTLKFFYKKGTPLDSFNTNSSNTPEYVKIGFVSALGEEWSVGEGLGI